MKNLSEALNAAVENIFSRMHCSLPGVIKSYDHNLQKASVQPLINRKYFKGKVQEMPIISSVPVIHPRTKNALIHLPIHEGDYVLLLFADRSLDIWLEKGEATTPDDPRKHSLSDCIAIPGLLPFSAFSGSLKPENDQDLILQHNDSYLILRENGDINIKGDTEIEGDLKVKGKIEASGDIIAGSGTPIEISLLSHQHIGNLGSPTSPPIP